MVVGYHHFRKPPSGWPQIERKQELGDSVRALAGPLAHWRVAKIRNVALEKSNIGNGHSTILMVLNQERWGLSSYVCLRKKVVV